MLNGQMLRTLRVLAGIPQWRLAKVLGISQTVISTWERGEYAIPQGRIPQVMAALGIHKKRKAAKRRYENKSFEPTTNI
jgi:transcriptional regulator with XRE-family HTH domain